MRSEISSTPATANAPQQRTHEDPGAQTHARDTDRNPNDGGRSATMRTRTTSCSVVAGYRKRGARFASNADFETTRWGLP